MSKTPKPLFPKKILLFASFGLLVLVLYLYYFVGTSNIAGVIGRVDLLTYAAAFLAFTLSILFSSFAWHSLLCNLSVKVKIKRVFFFMWVGMFFDATVPEPGWSGDLSKAYMLAKTYNEDSGKTVASIVSQKIIGMGITVLDLILGLVLLARNYLLPESTLIFLVAVLLATVGSLAIVWYLSTHPKATGKILGGVVRITAFLLRGRWDAKSFKVRSDRFLNRFHEGIRTLSAKPMTLVKPTLFSLVSWGFDVSVVSIVFAALGYPIPLDKVLIIYALTGTLQIMGISFVGFTEVIVSGAYTVLGVQPALSLSVTLLTRVVTLWFKLVVSYVAFQYACVRILTDNQTSRTK
jgi:uncharacterized protein (TIRG00374 family)